MVLTNSQHSIAVLGVADTIRQTSLGAFDQLRKMGVHLVMLSSDNQKTTQTLALHMKINYKKQPICKRNPA